MAIKCHRIFFRYFKCLVITALLAFFLQILIAIIFFPSENDSFLHKNGHKTFSHQSMGDVSARKLIVGFDDDEDMQKKELKRPVSQLRLEELDFKPTCEITNREAISAIHRAKTQMCKQQIVNKTCLIQNGDFYPKVLPNKCLGNAVTYGRHLGCYQDEKKLRLLSSFYGNYANTNTPSNCLDICVQAGFPYAGVQYASECFCGESAPMKAAKISEQSCDMKCPGDPSKTCGGYFTINVYETGLSSGGRLMFQLIVDDSCCTSNIRKDASVLPTLKRDRVINIFHIEFTPVTPKTSNSKQADVKIIFLLTLNGRALRQVYRLINVLYRKHHYIYIHVDARQDYLHRKLSTLEKKFPNIKLATNRYSTIWGGASLLKMLLSSMKDFFTLGWQWDFVINLSESDFPIKSLDKLESFLSVNKGHNFVKSHGREVQRFIKKQGLDKTFIECDTHMWRVGERKLPRGIVIDGGSDWIALSPDFVAYIVGKNDELLDGLNTIFEHTLLPAESFFHTVLRNSRFCNTYVDNNLHVTNWKRKLGCKCQYKHVVDWCGCSPNDFRTEDWPRIQNTLDRQLFFARKFEPVINQEIINKVEQFIGLNDQHLVKNIDAYWQSIYDTEDLPASTDDTLLTHASSITRLNAKILLESDCLLKPGDVNEINSYNYADVYKGNLILHKAYSGTTEVLIETWYKPMKQLELNFEHPYVDNVKVFQVSSDYDQKEVMFRNTANILGPLSEPTLLYQFLPPIEKQMENLTAVWLDPAGVIADVSNIRVDENNLTNHIKPNIKQPLLSGVWKVGLFEQSRLIAFTKFLITPLEYFSSKELTHRETSILHSGSQNSYKNFSNVQTLGFVPSLEETLLLQKIATSNIKRVNEDLREWIDSLNVAFYKVLGSCVALSSADANSKFKCGKNTFEYCDLVEWSSLSPDPKGRIGKLNKITGNLDRV